MGCDVAACGDVDQCSEVGDGGFAALGPVGGVVDVASSERPVTAREPAVLVPRLQEPLLLYGRLI